ncbi:TPA: hypothetical protein UZ441_004828 [Escherichia coli]|nr:hypothetical protein [Escherichia coli]HEL8025984.1 hypothetical protein [Escherichia coli]HEL8044701.1 hypothetical protein [Escherichia coli]HEL8049406.1 hypothetical protein [Escherichia coli]HEL8054245.1 hypothetical protein [Escherichia coli]
MNGHHKNQFVVNTREHLRAVRGAYSVALELYNIGDYSAADTLFESLRLNIRHLLNDNSFKLDSYENTLLVRYYLMASSLIRGGGE